jgi:hypothetical protein
METGVALGGASLLIHIIEKSIMILRHFHMHSTCCGQKMIDIQVDTSTPPSEKPLMGQPKHS